MAPCSLCARPRVGAGSFETPWDAKPFPLTRHVLQFDTAFKNKKEAVETVTPMLDQDGKWRVTGYFVK